MIGFEEYKKDIYDFVKNRKPKAWRKGQAVFNYVFQPVARKVQLVDNVDCFYDDRQIEEFIKLAYDTLVEMEKNGEIFIEKNEEQ